MIAAIIRWSVSNRPLVLLVTAMLVVWGAVSVRHTPLDAIPDLSDVQVIVKTWPRPGAPGHGGPGHLSAHHRHAGGPGCVHVRGYSFFGESYVYIIFEDGTDLYWARSRVLEYLSQVRDQLPPMGKHSLDRTPAASAGSMNMRWSTAPAGTICRSCAASRTGI